MSLKAHFINVLQQQDVLYPVGYDHNGDVSAQTTLARAGQPARVSAVPLSIRTRHASGCYLLRRHTVTAHKTTTTTDNLMPPDIIDLIGHILDTLIIVGLVGMFVLPFLPKG